MKRCPTCSASYPDDGPIFCLNDGARLTSDAPPASFDPQKTMLAPPPPPFNQQPPPFQNPQSGAQGYQAMPPPQPYQQQPQQPYQSQQPYQQQQPFQPQQQQPWGYQPQQQRPAPYGGTAANASGGMKDKLQPALIGGLIAGVPTILPFLGRGFCLWAAAGGFVAGMMYIRRSAAPVKIPDGLMVGGMAGVIAALILLVIGLPLSYLTRSFSGYIMLANQRYSLVGFLLFGGLISAFLLALFGALGGLLSVPLFEKRNAGAQNFPMPPPPPPNYGGPAGGGYR